MCCFREDLKQRAINKGISLHKDLTYRVIAIGFDYKNNLVGMKSNGFGYSSRRGSGKHAERELISRYGKSLSTIVIIRIGRSGNILPIEPCYNCQKVADKLGIKIKTYNA